jgi:hypothetical protein
MLAITNDIKPPHKADLGPCYGHYQVRNIMCISKESYEALCPENILVA